MSDFYPPHYPAHNFAEPHRPYQQPYGQQYGQGYPPQQWQSPPPQMQNYYPQPAPQRQMTPEQIWAEANGGSNNQQPQARGSDFFSQGPSAPDAMQGQQGGDGERGIGATLLGGGAGAFLGHEMGHGKMATLGGLAVGAIAANAFEHHHKKKKEERHLEHAYDDGYHRGESRGIDDDYRDDYRDDRSYDGRRSIESSRGGDRYYDDRRSFEEERDYDYEPPRHHHHHHHRDDYDDDYRSDSYYQQSDVYSRRDY